MKEFIVVYFGTQENSEMMAAHFYVTEKVIRLRKDKKVFSFCKMSGLCCIYHLISAQLLSFLSGRPQSMVESSFGGVPVLNRPFNNTKNLALRAFSTLSSTSVSSIYSAQVLHFFKAALTVYRMV